MQSNLPIVIRSDSIDSLSSGDTTCESIFNISKIERPKLQRDNKQQVMSNFEITNELKKINNKIDELLSLLIEKNK